MQWTQQPGVLPASCLASFSVCGGKWSTGKKSPHNLPARGVAACPFNIMWGGLYARRQMARQHSLKLSEWLNAYNPHYVLRPRNGLFSAERGTSSPVSQLSVKLMRLTKVIHISDELAGVLPAQTKGNNATRLRLVWFTPRPSPSKPTLRSARSRNRSLLVAVLAILLARPPRKRGSPLNLYYVGSMPPTRAQPAIISQTSCELLLGSDIRAAKTR